MKKEKLYQLRSLFREFIEDYFTLNIKDGTLPHLKVEAILDELYKQSEQGIGE